MEELTKPQFIKRIIEDFISKYVSTDYHDNYRFLQLIVELWQERKKENLVKLFNTQYKKIQSCECIIPKVIETYSKDSINYLLARLTNEEINPQKLKKLYGILKDEPYTLLCYFYNGLYEVSVSLTELSAILTYILEMKSKDLFIKKTDKTIERILFLLFLKMGKSYHQDVYDFIKLFYEIAIFKATAKDIKRRKDILYYCLYVLYTKKITKEEEQKKSGRYDYLYKIVEHDGSNIVSNNYNDLPRIKTITTEAFTVSSKKNVNVLKI